MHPSTHLRFSLAGSLRVLCLLGAGGLGAFFFFSPAAPQHPERDQLFSKVSELVTREYVETREREALLIDAIKGMVHGLDPYSRFYEPSELASLEEETSGQYVGIGVHLELAGPPLTVLFPHPGSPAETAGLETGDRIVSIDGEPVEALASGGTGADRLRAARERILGLPGSEVTLSVLRDGEEVPREIAVRRESIVAGSVKWARRIGPEGRVGYVHVSEFKSTTPNEFDEAVRGLREAGATSLVVDLRWNRGGVLDAATAIVNRFLREGVIVSMRGRTPSSTSVCKADPELATLQDVPLVVLVNSDSASASEIVAAAIQEHRLGVLVGERTWGKGVVQSLKPIAGFDVRVKLTTAYYFTPLGRNLEKNLGRRPGETRGGIEPDIVIHLDPKLEVETERRLAETEVPAPVRERVGALRAKLGVPLHKVQLTPEQDPQLAAALDVLLGITVASRLSPQASPTKG